MAARKSEIRLVAARATRPPAEEAPSIWARVRGVLMAVGRRIGQVQTWLLLTVFYFVLLAPAGLLFRLLADPLRLRQTRSIWRSRPPRTGEPMSWAKSQS